MAPSPYGIQAVLHQMRTFPLTWLHLSRSIKLLLVVISYVLGIAGLFFLFPPTHNAATMFLPIACTCWLFRYRGLFVSLLLNGIGFQLTYFFLLRGLLPDSSFIEGGIVGFITSFGIGLVVCWLRTAVDSANEARQHVLATEQVRLLTEFRERQILFAYEQQCKVNALKNQFLLNVSHELRTPLTVLTGFLELLAAHHEHLDLTERTDMLQKALVSQEELIALVDRILDATTIMGDIPSAHVEAVNLQRLLQDMLTQPASGHFAAYTIHMEVYERIMVQVDPQFLCQILYHLFANIFNYVPPHTEIHIEASQATPQDQVCLSIQDEGPGIPAEELPLLFEKFVRLKRDLAGSTRGAGLGLYISKQLIEAMGGRIWVESPNRAGIGSRFCLALPSIPPA